MKQLTKLGALAAIGVLVVACAPEPTLPESSFADDDLLGLTDDDKADGVWSWSRVWDNARRRVDAFRHERHDRERSLFDRGIEGATAHAREIWDEIKSFDCVAMLDGFSAFDPAKLYLDRLWKPAGTCFREFRRGLLCSLPFMGGMPSMTTAVEKVAFGSIRAAWEHRPACFRTAVLSGPLASAGYVACGFYYYARPRVEKMARCAERLYREDKLWAMLWSELWQLGCEKVGRLALDVVINAVTGGIGIPATIVYWVHKIWKLLSPVKWLRIANEFGHQTADLAARYLLRVAEGLSECVEDVGN